MFDQAFDENNDPVYFMSVGGVLTVLEPEYGDANGDGAIDLMDANLLKVYLASFDGESAQSDIEIQSGADANGDGKIDASESFMGYMMFQEIFKEEDDEDDDFWKG